MKRAAAILLLATAPMLGGCLASLAASAVGAAVTAAAPGPQPYSTQNLRPGAIEDCTARAAQHGTVHIIDAEQGRGNRVTVWGTVQDAQQRRSFECIHDRQVASFRLREIRAQ